MKKFSRALGISLKKLTIVDIGAMAVGEDIFDSLIAHEETEVIGFEPQADECARLNALHPKRRYLPYFIGDGHRHTFHLTNSGLTSSLLEPDMAFLSAFTGLAEVCQVVDRAIVDTVRLDDVAEITTCDYLKIDVQGAEKMIFANAKRVLADTLVIHTEVEFAPLYRNQPLFGDVDAELRSQGFVFHCFTIPTGRAFAPVVLNGDLNRSVNQQLWADAVYIRDFMQLARLSDEQLLAFAALMHEVYASFDLATMLLTEYDRRRGDTCAQRYLAALA